MKRRTNGDDLKITHIAFRPIKSKVRHNPQNFTKSKKAKFQDSMNYMGEKKPQFYWNCSSMVIKDATPLTPQAHERNSLFKCKQDTWNIRLILINWMDFTA